MAADAPMASLRHFLSFTTLLQTVDKGRTPTQVIIDRRGEEIRELQERLRRNILVETRGICANLLLRRRHHTCRYPCQDKQSCNLY